VKTTAVVEPSVDLLDERTSQCVKDYQKREDSASRYESRKSDCEKADAAFHDSPGKTKTDGEAEKTSA